MFVGAPAGRDRGPFRRYRGAPRRVRDLCKMETEAWPGLGAMQPLLLHRLLAAVAAAAVLVAATLLV